MNKNEIYEFEIIDSGMNFEGIAKKDGQVVFIPGAIIGEKVEAKIIKVNSSYAIGKVEELLNKSKYRVEEFCPVFKRCGGCSCQNIDYDMQLILKNKMVESLLRKQKVSYSKLNSTIGMGRPYYYRNKVQYPTRSDNHGNSKIGFYSNRSHSVIENDCCYIENRVIDILSKTVFDIFVKNNFTMYNDDTKQGEIKHLLIRRGYHTGEIMVVIIISDKLLANDNRFNKVIEEITKNENVKSIFLNINESNTNEIVGEECVKIYGDDYISDYIGEFKYMISPKSFFQVNTIQAEVLYSTLKEFLNLQGDEVLFDLYSGVGSIGIFLSKEAKEVYGIEIEEEAVKMANINLKENDVNNAEYIAGSVEDKIEEFKLRNIKPDVIVVDPPRKGLDERSIKYILDFNPKKIGYISCNPATLARDLKLLEEKYDIVEITPVDMFPHTSHVECVAFLELKYFLK